jgi:small subunit ribosomal protein S18
MATRKITRKVITPVKSVQAKPKQEVIKVEEQPEEVVASGDEKFERSSIRAKKGCPFCQAKTTPSYTDLSVLRRFLTDRAKIVNKERSGVCSRHQRAVAKNIKYARHLSLLPFVPKV